MAGHVQQRGPNSWRLHVFAGRDPETGKKQFVYRTVRGTKKDAERELRKLTVEVDDGKHSFAKASFGDLCERWFAVASPGWSESNATSTRSWLDRRILRWADRNGSTDGLPQLGDLPLARLSTYELDRWYSLMLTRGSRTDGPLAASTIKRIRVIVHAALEQGVKWDMVPSNPDDRTTRPEVVERDIEPPTPAEVKKFIEAFMDEDPETALFIRMSATVITRRGELARLQWKSVDLNAGTIRLPQRTNKTNRTRLVTLGPETLAWLRRHHIQMAERALRVGLTLTPEAYVFSYEAACRTPMNPQAITRRFIRLRGHLGLDHVRLHDLRHFAATQALGKGVDVVTVAERGGWANANVLLRTYAAFLPANDQAAAALLDDVLDADVDASARGRR